MEETRSNHIRRLNGTSLGSQLSEETTLRIEGEVESAHPFREHSRLRLEIR